MAQWRTNRICVIVHCGSSLLLLLLLTSTFDDKFMLWFSANRLRNVRVCFSSNEIHIPIVLCILFFTQLNQWAGGHFLSLARSDLSHRIVLFMTLYALKPDLFAYFVILSNATMNIKSNLFWRCGFISRPFQMFKGSKHWHIALIWCNKPKGKHAIGDFSSLLGIKLTSLIREHELKSTIFSFVWRTDCVEIIVSSYSIRIDSKVLRRFSYWKFCM